MSDLRRVSLSVQLRDELWGLIREEHFRPGERLPSEHELAQRFGVSRMTLREALKSLEDDRVIVCRHGVGRFVASGPLGVVHEGITSLKSVTEMSTDQAIPVSARVLSISERIPTERERDHLQLDSGMTVVELERERISDGETMIYSVDIFPRKLIKGKLGDYDFGGSLFAIMEEAWGIRVTYAKTLISAVVLDADQRSRLAVKEGLPWIMLEQVNHDERDNPVLYSRDYHRGDKFRFYVLRRRR